MNISEFMHLLKILFEKLVFLLYFVLVIQFYCLFLSSLFIYHRIFSPRFFILFGCFSGCCCCRCRSLFFANLIKKGFDMDELTLIVDSMVWIYFHINGSSYIVTECCVVSILTWDMRYLIAWIEKTLSHTLYMHTIQFDKATKKEKPNKENIFIHLLFS